MSMRRGLLVLLVAFAVLVAVILADSVGRSQGASDGASSGEPAKTSAVVGQLGAGELVPSPAAVGSTGGQVGAGVGESEETAPNQVSPMSGSGFTAVSPVRLADTRPGFAPADGQGPRQGVVGPGQSIEMLVTGRGSVPAAGVGAVALNVTAVTASARTFVTVFPTGSPRPTASNLNPAAGQTIANMVLVKVGDGGRVTVYNDKGSTHLIVDLLGWFPVSSDFSALSPVRVADTRLGLAPPDGKGPRAGVVGPGQSIDLQLAGRAGLPSSGVGAVALNVTAVTPSASTFVTVFPAGSTRPTASNLNPAVGQTVPNMVLVKTGADGKVTLYNDKGSTHLIVDLLGWFPTTSDFAALSPVRLADTRAASPPPDGLGPPASVVGPGQSIEVQVTGRGGVPATGVGAVALNVTAVEPSTQTFVTVFPAGSTRPTASNLNPTAGRTVPNMVLVKVGAGGKVSVYNDKGTLHLIVDVFGWFPELDPTPTPTPTDTPPSAATASVAGLVRAANGSPVSGYTVAAYTPAGDFVGDTLTTTSGAYALAGLPRGNYRLRVSGPQSGAAPWAMGWIGGQPSLLTAQQVTVGSTPAKADAVLTPAATVTGRVLGVPTGSEVRLCGASFLDCRTGTTTNAQGDFQVRGLAAGTASIVVRPVGRADLAFPAQPPRAGVVLRANQTTQVQLDARTQAAPQVSVQGQPVTPTAAPPPADGTAPQVVSATLSEERGKRYVTVVANDGQGGAGLARVQVRVGEKEHAPTDYSTGLIAAPGSGEVAVRVSDKAGNLSDWVVAR